jgi:hypothetical protein
VLFADVGDAAGGCAAADARCGERPRQRASPVTHGPEVVADELVGLDAESGKRRRVHALIFAAMRPPVSDVSW